MHIKIILQVKLAEDASPGQTFFTIIAIDRDEDGTGIVTYQLLTKNSLFNLNPISGEISVASPGLDFEKNKIHRIKVKAFDNGRPPLSSQTTVEVNVLDVNDNRPRIFVSTPPGGIAETLSCSRSAANCTVFVDENSNFSVVRGLLLVNATDADGETNAGPFRYRIKMGNERGLFNISPLLYSLTYLKLFFYILLFILISKYCTFLYSCHHRVNSLLRRRQ